MYSELISHKVLYYFSVVIISAQAGFSLCAATKLFIYFRLKRRLITKTDFHLILGRKTTLTPHSACQPQQDSQLYGDRRAGNFIVKLGAQKDLKETFHDGKARTETRTKNRHLDPKYEYFNSRTYENTSFYRPGGIASICSEEEGLFTFSVRFLDNATLQRD